MWVGVWYSPLAIPIPKPKNASKVDPKIMRPENYIPLCLVISGNLETWILISFSIPLKHFSKLLIFLLFRPLNLRISIEQFERPLVNLLLAQRTTPVTVLPGRFIVLVEGFDLFSTKSHLLSLQQWSISTHAQRSCKHRLSCFLH